VPNGIPTKEFAHPRTSRTEWRAKEGFRDDQVLFVCVARLAPQKNHALLLKAFAKGPGCNLNAHLVLVGDGILREQLKEQAECLGLKGQTHFLGVRDDIPEVLGAMDVFVLSSDWEGNPLSAMEAMAAGLPIISTAVGGVPGLFANGEEGFLHLPGDAQGLANSMTFLLNKTEARKSMGAAAARRAQERFDVSRMVQEYEQMYEDLFNHSHPLKAEGVFRQRGMSLRDV